MDLLLEYLSFYFWKQVVVIGIRASTDVDANLSYILHKKTIFFILYTYFYKTPTSVHLLYTIFYINNIFIFFFNIILSPFLFPIFPILPLLSSSFFFFLFPYLSVISSFFSSSSFFVFLSW